MIYNQFDVVVVPFPFVDSAKAKRRPALILSSHKHFNNETKHSIMAMITSARNNPWAGDVDINNLTSAGLSKPSVIRWKLFTLDHRLILDSVGTLSPKDQKAIRAMMNVVFNGLI